MKKSRKQLKQLVELADGGCRGYRDCAECIYSKICDCLYQKYHLRNAPATTYLSRLRIKQIIGRESLEWNTQVIS